LIDPASLSEVIASSRPIESRSATGTLSSWPAPPDSTNAPLRGRNVTLFGPSLAAPRVGRLTFGISQAVGYSGAIHLTANYGHTDYLLRRQELNLPLSTTGLDANGRPLYGTLQQYRGVLVAAPGSDRRFSAFDHIWALNADGYSDYWGVTAAVERESQNGLRLLVSYTYSKTTDNRLGQLGLGGGSQLTPFPGGLNGRDWADGTSDFDVPHNVSVGVASPTIPRIGARLGVLYSYRSGYSFTPGFRDGVDMNGDGSFGNDPAFIDPAAPGASALLQAWPCLAQQQGQMAARNSCRAAGVSRLDLRLRLATLHTLQGDAQVIVDALNLLDSDDAIPDRAVYLVNPTGSTTTNASTGVVTVPLVINPNFGRPLLRLTTGRSVRLGLRLER
jgi:hypothetical protein